MSESTQPLYTEKDIYDLVKHFQGDALDAEKQVKEYLSLHGKDKLEKDSVPSRPRFDQRLYENGPFTLFNDEVYSSMASGGSALMQWLPVGTIKSRVSHVQHLNWVAPEGFDGSTQTYPEWLASNGIIDECGYGPSTSWSGFTWQHTGGSFSWTTGTMKPYEDGGIRYYEQQNAYMLRGVNNGMRIDNDKDFAISRILYSSEQHLDYVLHYGDLSNSNMEWDGLDQIIRPGYVPSRAISGTPSWAEPIVANGAGLSVSQVLTAIRIAVRRIVGRAMDRNWGINAGDMVVYMSRTMWDNLAEHVAAGAAHKYTNTYGFEGKMNFDVFDRRYREARQGGAYGHGTLILDGGIAVPVICSSSMGDNSTSGGNASVTGDIYILTRRAGGMDLLQQQFLDWTNLDYPAIGENQIAIQGGLLRTGYVQESNKCYYYYAEMQGRVSSFMQPMQARIMNVTVPTLGESENESSAFFMQDFYGKQPSGILTPTF